MRKYMQKLVSTRTWTSAPAKCGYKKVINYQHFFCISLFFSYLCILEKQPPFTFNHLTL